MDQWLKENMQSFMVGLEIVLVGMVAAMLIGYFVIKHNIKKKKATKN